MNRSHNNITLIENWLEINNTIPCLDDDFVRHVYEAVLENNFILKNKESVKRRQRGFSLQYDFVRRDLLKIIHKQNNYSANNISAGYVYAIGNPAWADYVKIGSAIDVDDRLNSYQTSSPKRDYYLIDYYFVLDRRKEESYLHSLYSDKEYEWCKTTVNEIKKIFKERKLERIISPTIDKLWEIKDIENTKLNAKKNDWYVVLGVDDDIQ